VVIGGIVERAVSPRHRDNDAMSIRTRAVSGLAALVVGLCAGCAPALDWREFVPEGSGINVSFPCRPDRQARAVTLAGEKVRMEMLACAAEGMTFALAFADVTDPGRTGAALLELEDMAVRNVGGGTPERLALQMAGMTPHAEAARLSIAGLLPDGAAVRAHAAFFSRGLRVYQATVIGAKPESAVVDLFLRGMRFPG
jgi:hypothetical protein